MADPYETCTGMDGLHAHPLGELHFTSFFKDPENMPHTYPKTQQLTRKFPKHDLTKDYFLARKSLPTPPQTDILGTLGSLGIQMGARTAKIIRMTSKIIPGATTIHKQNKHKIANNRLGDTVAGKTQFKKWRAFPPARWDFFGVEI